VKFGVSRRPDPLIDLTPMIDIVFQLVLFFMVSTTFVNSPGIQVELPRSNVEDVIVENRDITIWMNEEGQIMLNREYLDLTTLKSKLRELARQDLNQLVIIKADVETTHGRVVAVMDLVRTYGFSRMAIATDGVVAGQGTEDDHGTP
jgi:biopolymer transport protein ExbD/biopolymer transport protein TolR